GQNNPKATVWDPSVLAGWGVRDSNWDFSSELQRQLGERMSVTAGYYFNTGGYFRNTAALSKNRVTDNILVVPTDYDKYCVTAPANAGLPDGGGYNVCGLYDINPTQFGKNQSVVTLASNFGKPVYR